MENTSKMQHCIAIMCYPLTYHKPSSHTNGLIYVKVLLSHIHHILLQLFNSGNSIVQTSQEFRISLPQGQESS